MPDFSVNMEKSGMEHTRTVRAGRGHLHYKKQAVGFLQIFAKRRPLEVQGELKLECGFIHF
ncbi:hypothetical protein X874_19540 [Mannheimia varigena USDA-ARS-USMARC-1312]|uniref:Uncharacterized protein n=1 Tax=Mannheimia varigena USDA-ARS-USMARC-1296 TaxID=1433287 RepID=W0QCG5_9PAST|nr:hypothetical protein [Mannheimia varigena]AHG76599.1 hypothetical protein X808_20810 [Mannheimia varigena USDA-ARS-USMARC-1296]AHG78587.1 hypothetical protein X874_19540 [Mannheimia varigena USDA-ARS-USMARC-1312]AHG78666.1 hypothetical protein X875_440 [Mannheimia varigena USDA-ARS-USMARC-1388]TLU75859.1 hypothetical protein FE589_05005 [Mannheimia varigena]